MFEVLLTAFFPHPHSAHQAIMRTNLLKEELEELKISMNASEEQKTMIVAQNKQLVSHPSTLELADHLFNWNPRWFMWRQRSEISRLMNELVTP